MDQTLMETWPPRLALIWWSSIIFLLVLGTVRSAWLYLYCPKLKTINESELPPVTILRPLKGLDTDIARCLESSLLQDYPLDRLEVIFCVGQENDPVIPLVQALIKKFPNVSARLSVGETFVGVNPKINNLISAYHSAKHDIMWVCDSNIWCSPQTLKRSVTALLGPKVGLVHHSPVGIDPKSVGSDLEMHFLNAVHPKVYLGINALGPSSCVVGKSNLYRRSDLNKCGGMQAFGKYMAEDNTIGQAIWDLGLRHIITPDLALQTLGSMSTKDYFMRRCRWARIRKYTVTLATIAEPLTECLPLSAMFAYFVRHLISGTPSFSHWLPPISSAATTPMSTLFSWMPTSFQGLFGLHLVCWFFWDLGVSAIFANATGRKINLSTYTRAWLIRELTALPLYLWAIAGSSVRWRNVSYQLLRGGTVIQSVVVQKAVILAGPVTLNGPKSIVVPSCQSPRMSSSPTNYGSEDASVMLKLVDASTSNGLSMHNRGGCGPISNAMRQRRAATTPSIALTNNSIDCDEAEPLVAKQLQTIGINMGQKPQKPLSVSTAKSYALFPSSSSSSTSLSSINRPRRLSYAPPSSNGILYAPLALYMASGGTTAALGNPLTFKIGWDSSTMPMMTMFRKSHATTAQ